MKTYYICAGLIFVLIYAVFHFGFRTGGAEQLYRINDKIAFEVQPEDENYNGVSIHGFKPTGTLIGFLCGACQSDDETIFLANAKYRRGDWVYTDFPQHEQAPTDLVNLRTGETIIAHIPADFKFGDELSKLPEYKVRGLIKSGEFALTRSYVTANFQPLSSLTSRCVYAHLLFFVVGLILAFPKVIFWIVDAISGAFDPQHPSNIYYNGD